MVLSAVWPTTLHNFPTRTDQQQTLQQKLLHMVEKSDVKPADFVDNDNLTSLILTS